MLIDSHCHLDLPELADDLSNVLETMHANDVAGAVCIGVTLEDFPKISALVEEHSNLVASVGVHPENTGVSEPSVKTLVELADNPEVVAIGETGLDYYWHKDRPEWQRQRFRTHIRAARATGKPLIIHNREATADVLCVLGEEKADQVGGVMHCFTESWTVAQAALDLGFHISISGIVTFKNALDVKEVARRTPLERLLIETDAPYLAPAPYRGKRNQPGYVKYVAEEIARLRQVTVEEIAQATSENCLRLFPYLRKKMKL